MTIRIALRALTAGAAMLSLMIAQSALLAVHPRASGEDKSEKIRQLLRINGFEKQISKAPDTLKAQLRAKQARSGGNRDEQAYVEEVVFEAFNPAEILNRVIANMAGEEDQGWLRETLVFLKSPLGRKMTRMEIDASGPESYRAMVRFGRRLGEKPPPQARVRVIHQVNSAGRVFESSLDTAVNMSMAIVLALEAAKPRKQLLDEEHYRQARARVKEALTERMRNIVFLRLLYTYRQASDGDLKEYIRFYQGAAGKKYVTLMNEAVGKAIISLTWEAAKKIKVKSRL